MTEQRHEDDGRFARWSAKRRAAHERDLVAQEQIDLLLRDYPVDPDRRPPARTRPTSIFGGWGTSGGGGDWSFFGGDGGGFGGGDGGGGGC